MATARWFDESKLEPGMVLPYGVPMRDLSDEDWDAYGPDVQASIDSWPLFRKTKPRAPRTEGDDRETET